MKINTLLSAPYAGGLACLALATVLLAGGNAWGTSIDVLLDSAGGTTQTAYSGWGSVSWQALSLADEPVATSPDIDDQIDFVGNSTYGGGYWAANDSYVFFRMRLDLDAIGTLYTTFTDTHMLLIDVLGQQFDTITPANQLVAPGTLSGPDYGFAWDSSSGGGVNQLKNHGLEMVRRSTAGESAWSGVRMDDLDTQSGQKLANDINGSTRTTDGYVHLTDGLSTTDFGATTFLDFAVSWNYLITNTDLRAGQTWNVTFASIHNSNDHALLDADIAGGTSPGGGLTTGWSGSITPTPEPSSLVLALPLVGMLFARRRWES